MRTDQPENEILRQPVRPQETIEEAAEASNYRPVRKENQMPKSFSGGMKRRLNIACAIAHKPKLIIMDEPTVGIDPQSEPHTAVGEEA